MGRTLVRNEITNEVSLDISIYHGVCVLFIYFLKRFATMNSFFFLDNSIFLEIAIQSFLEKDVDHFYNVVENL